MRDKNDGTLFLAEYFKDLILKFAAGHGVECGEGFVHQDDSRLQAQGLRDGDALLHAARQLVRIIMFISGQPHFFKSPVRAAPELRLVADSLELQRILDIFLHCFPREELVEVLKDHHDVADGAAPFPAVDPDAALIGFKPRDTAQQGCLAAAGRPEYAQEFALP